MRQLKVALAGLGSRGKDTYAVTAKLFPEKMKIVAIADTDAAEDVAALQVGTEPVLSRRRQKRLAQVLLVGVVGQDARRHGGDDGDDREDQDEDAADQRGLVRNDAGDDVAPHAFALLAHGLGRLDGSLDGSGGLGCELVVLAHADHPSSFVPNLMRGSR